MDLQNKPMWLTDFNQGKKKSEMRKQRQSARVQKKA